MTIVLGVPDFLEVTNLESYFLSSLAISISPTVNASNILTCSEGFSSCPQLNLIGAKGVDDGSTCIGVDCAKNTYLRSALVKDAYTGSTYVWGIGVESIARGIYIEDACTRGASDTCARDTYIRDICARGVCTRGTCSGGTYFKGLCIRKAYTECTCGGGFFEY